MDITKLSTADLEAISSGDLSKVSTKGLAMLAGEETPRTVIPMKASYGQVKPEMPWSAVPGKALSNIPSSSMNLVKNMASPILHPVDTFKALDNTVMGLGQKLIPGMQPQEQYVDAIGRAIGDRYGSMDALKNTLSNDPVGAAADVAGVAMGVGGLAKGAGRMIPGKVGPMLQKGGAALSKGAQMVDPANIAMKAPGAVWKYGVEPVVSHTIGTTTGAGGMALREAAKAGQKGGRTAEAFQEQMRGVAPIQNVVDDAKSAVSAMRQEKSAAYRSGMADLSKDKTVLDFAPINKALKDAEEIGSFKGKSIAPSTKEVWDNISETVSDWKKLNPKEYHTPEGMDALKKAIGDIRDSTPYNTPSRLVADRVFTSIKGQIVSQAPEYAKVMKGYEKATELISDIEKTLSTGKGATIDTTIRKLQSVMRNNANTNYGRRVDLAQTLSQSGAPDLMPKLAGQALSSPTPRGLQALGATGAGVTALATNPVAVGGLSFASPRLMGEVAYYGGKAAGALKPLGLMPSHIAGQSALQAGRTRNLLYPDMPLK